MYPLPQSINEQPCVALKDVFTSDELAAIREYGEGIPGVKGTIDRGSADLRKCGVGWIYPAVDTENIYRKVGDVVRQVNAHYFQFDLTELHEPLQYTIYRPGEHYDWHMDKGAHTAAPRKLSFTVQLSDSDEYEGGDFECRIGSEIEKLPRDRGQVIFFPSWLLHRVTPVTKGIRRSLVVWVHGPAFR